MLPPEAPGPGSLQLLSWVLGAPHRRRLCSDFVEKETKARAPVATTGPSSSDPGVLALRSHGLLPTATPGKFHCLRFSQKEGRHEQRHPQCRVSGSGDSRH